MIRKAKLGDVKEIQRLVKLYSTRGDILPRSLVELYDHLRDFYVFLQNRKVVGICALHICWEDLTEIRSLAVDEKARGKGIGAKVVRACLEESKALGAKKVFALTYRPDFFQRLNFQVVDRPVEGRMLGAVCAGLAKYLEIDPTLVRIGFVVGSLLGWFPAFNLAYVFMWILVPDETKVTTDLTPS